MLNILVARGLGEFRRDAVVGTDIEYVEFDSTKLLEAEVQGEFDTRFQVLSQKGIDLSDSLHRAWLGNHIEERSIEYLFLDPLYMLIGGVDEKDSAQLRPILNWLTKLKSELGCATVLTHHMSNKGREHGAAALLGSTYIEGWYEAALLTESTESHFVTLTVDARRDFGEVRKLSLQGVGVGHWWFTETAQDQTDSEGRRAPRKAEKETKMARYAEQDVAHPEWTDEQHGEHLGVSGKTIQRYRAELAERVDSDADDE